MGYSYRNGGQIKDFWPDNTPGILYIESSYAEIGFADIIHQIVTHFGDGIPLTDFTISAEYIHTSCLTYDLYDSSDWTNFLVIRKKK